MITDRYIASTALRAQGGAARKTRVRAQVVRPRRAGPRRRRAAGAKVSASVPVSSACAGSRARAANSAARRSGSRCTQRLVEQQQRREAARLGDQRGVAEDRRRSAAPSAGRCWPGRPVSPLAASASAMSARCAPDRGRARRGVLRARLAASAAAQPVLDRQRRVAAPAARRSGRAAPAGRPGSGAAAPSASAAFSRATSPARAAVDGDRVPRHRVLQPGEPGRVARGPRRAAGCAGHRRVVRRDLAGMAGLQRPDQPVEEAAAARRRPPRTAGPSAASARPRRPGPRSPPGCAAPRRRAGRPGGPPGPSGGVPVPIVEPAPRACRSAPATRPAAGRARAVAGQLGDCARRAGRARAPAAKPPPAGWSCRCRSGRAAR